jgi:catechol 2,3-dioxygenase-like lactoylglutathione lyase family enzyme
VLSQPLNQIGHVIVLCDDLERMKSFYCDLLAFDVDLESPTSITFRAGDIYLGLRKRTRTYDGQRSTDDPPGVQLAFLVTPEQVDAYHQQLVAAGTPIQDVPRNQTWGHRTMYFSDPEGNLLEIYGELVT